MKNVYLRASEVSGCVQDNCDSIIVLFHQH
jgi:hypothetical protein